MQLSKLEIHHVGYIVADLTEALRHLEETYGLIAETPYLFSPNRAWVSGKEVFDYCLRIAMVKTGSSGILELIQPIAGNGVHQQFLDAGRSGIQHICYSVKDYEKWREFFVKNKADIVFEAEIEDDRFGYRRCFYAEDQLTGMMFEIKEEPYFRK